MRPLPAVAPAFLLALGVNGDYEIFHQRYSADPAPMALNDRLWIYTTHDNMKPGYSMRDYNALSSDDLVNWRDEGIVFSFDSIDWADYVRLHPP